MATKSQSSSWTTPRYHRWPSWNEDAVHSSSDTMCGPQLPAARHRKRLPPTSPSEALWCATGRIGPAFRFLSEDLMMLACTEQHAEILKHLADALRCLGHALLPKLGQSSIDPLDAARPETRELVSLLALLAQRLPADQHPHPHQHQHQDQHQDQHPHPHQHQHQHPVSRLTQQDRTQHDHVEHGVAIATYSAPPPTTDVCVGTDAPGGDSVIVSGLDSAPLAFTDKVPGSVAPTRTAAMPAAATAAAATAAATPTVATPTAAMPTAASPSASAHTAAVHTAATPTAVTPTAHRNAHSPEAPPAQMDSSFASLQYDFASALAADHAALPHWRALVAAAAAAAAACDNNRAALAIVDAALEAYSARPPTVVSDVALDELSRYRVELCRLLRTPTSSTSATSATLAPPHHDFASDTASKARRPTASTTTAAAPSTSAHGSIVRSTGSTAFSVYGDGDSEVTASPPTALTLVSAVSLYAGGATQATSSPLSRTETAM
eukprot:NODE_6108_length_1705_cov_2.484791.p1 GENE.NODE_6108_length_1705_cov_2.484791~~NODE_6108_length_1705_cov_2.484791.p1  ORF type:complete len:515 (-),score=43.12 NODE_6108_length_1705_cov_2.484791:159-1640(-)